MAVEKSKPVSISLTPTQIETAKELAVKKLGKPSLTALFCALMVKELNNK